MADEDKENKVKEIMRRKEEHIGICIEKPVQARRVRTLFDNVHLINNSLPEIDFDEIELATSFLGHKLSAPLIIGAMTGGAESAKTINGNLAKAAEKLGLGMVVGSQRAGLYDKRLRETYAISRMAGPNIFIGSNIGGAQISAGFCLDDARKLVDMLDADALYVHLNPAQEVVQPEGDMNYRNVLRGIKSFVEGLDVPVVVKEVGFGISGEVARKLEEAGVGAIEVAGTGGTSYAAVEYYRAREMGMKRKERMGELLWDWGIPTAAAVYSAVRNTKLPVVSSGGIRTGMDVAKSIAMGASACSVAWPLLKPAAESAEKAENALSDLIYGLKTAMFLTGSSNIKELGMARYVVTGELKEWCDQLV
jgi:isopentenyl-diphosphate delta-isomerase